MKKILFQELRDLSNLRQAWKSVYNNGITSQSFETISEIKKFDLKADQNLRIIYRLLKQNLYEFQPSKGVALERKGKKPRPIAISKVQDRIVQRTLLDIIKKQKKIKCFVEHPFSFGGIPKRSIVSAIEKVCKAINNGYEFYIRSDIKNFFQNIPRKEALRMIYDNLPDASLNDILERATCVDLDNAITFKKEIKDLFPTEDIGVAQGCCLSPFLGNILLYDFDNQMNKGDVLCFRYIDDFIILAKNNKICWAAFKRGLKVLEKYGLNAYHPTKDKDKATCGSTRKSLHFLGCTISPSFVHPDKKTINRLIEKIEKHIDSSKSILGVISTNTYVNYDYSLSKTIYEIHKTLNAWGNHYSFCNSNLIFKGIDENINRIIANYMDYYFKLCRNANENVKRRLLGAYLLIDSNSKSIYPLDKDVST